MRGELGVMRGETGGAPPHLWVVGVSTCVTVVTLACQDVSVTPCLRLARVCTRACVRVREQLRGVCTSVPGTVQCDCEPHHCAGHAGAATRGHYQTPAMHAHSGWGQQEQACHSPILGCAHSAHPEAGGWTCPSDGPPSSLLPKCSTESQQQQGAAPTKVRAAVTWVPLLVTSEGDCRVACLPKMTPYQAKHSPSPAVTPAPPVQEEGVSWDCPPPSSQRNRTQG